MPAIDSRLGRAGVEDAQQALAQLILAQEDGEPYRVVVTDMHMPGTDGFELVERIRRIPTIDDIAAVMLTSGGGRGDTERCRKMGIRFYAHKPIRRKELLSTILAASGHYPTVVDLPKSTPAELSSPAEDYGFCWPRTIGSTRQSSGDCYTRDTLS